MAIKIERGRRQTPVRAVIYGTEGIGKSTLAAAFPSPVILDTEEGTHHWTWPASRLARGTSCVPPWPRSGRAGASSGRS